MKKPDILLVGYGRFGRLAAGLLRPRWKVHVLERRRSLRLPPWIDRAQPGDIGRFGVVVLAIPAAGLKTFLGRYGRRITPGAFVCDVCAVKAAPIGWMRRHLDGGVSYAGLHPLFGPDSAAGGVRGRSVAVCRGRLTAACHSRLISTIRKMGLKPVETTPAIHDRTMASTLFLTQIVGLAAGAADRGLHPFVTPSYPHLKVVIDRSAGNSGALLDELARWNRYVPAVLRRFEARSAREIRKIS
jgi:prephenate dehydrogenase